MTLTKNMKIAVSGSNGFIGSTLVNHFAKKGHNVYAISRCSVEIHEQNQHISTSIFPEISPEILESVLKQNLPDVYIHCIGSPTVYFAQKNPHLDFENTIVSLSTALESMRRFSPKTLFVLLSSAAVYGGGDGQLAEESLCKPLSVYGSNKRIAELLALEYREQFNLSTLILRPFSVYGDDLQKQVIYDLYKKLNDPSIQHLVIDGIGSELRDFIHIADVASGIEHLVNNRSTGVVNLGTGKPTSLSDLTLTLGSLVNSAKSISFSGIPSPLNPQILVADTHYAKSLGC